MNTIPTPATPQEAMDQVLALQMERHAWLSVAAEQVRRWREEDRRNGIIWADEQQSTARNGSRDNREREVSNGLPSNQ